eukprot:775651-Pelagomonas_calceolata.AAC.7
MQAYKPACLRKCKHQKPGATHGSKLWTTPPGASAHTEKLMEAGHTKESGSVRREAAGACTCPQRQMGTDHVRKSGPGRACLNVPQRAVARDLPALSAHHDKAHLSMRLSLADSPCRGMAKQLRGTTNGHISHTQ